MKLYANIDWLNLINAFNYVSFNKNGSMILNNLVINLIVNLELGPPKIMT